MLDYLPPNPIAPVGVRHVRIETPFGSLRLRLDNAQENYNMADVIGELVRPALLAHGYSPETVEDFVPEVYG